MALREVTEELRALLRVAKLLRETAAALPVETASIFLRAAQALEERASLQAYGQPIETVLPHAPVDIRC